MMINLQEAEIEQHASMNRDSVSSSFEEEVWGYQGKAKISPV